MDKASYSGRKRRFENVEEGEKSMKKILSLSAVLFLSIQLITAQNSVRKVIIDTDTAGDDCMAIMMAAKSKGLRKSSTDRLKEPQFLPERKV